MKFLLVTSFFILFLSSCSTRDQIVYFQDAEDLEGMENLLDYEPVIQPNDVLRINVSSEIEEIVAPFQNQASRGSGGGGGGNLSLTGYLTNPEGFIQFPILGPIKVGGKTRGGVQKLLQEKIREYVTDAVVDVRIVNFNVTVLGEVNARVPVTDGRISMPELLATAGGIPYTGKRENILIIREVNGIKSIGRIDMTETNLFSSPYYYLRQNDIVYVEPTYRRIKSAGFFTNYQGIISVGTTIISLYLLINNL
ncbi:polysaccharide biosynthesis/export family protein [Salegentibacter sp. F188]|uniref:Polysaccharide biosynthesis/export family protein n=1 Tax=Autumnicola patrickiae TaxID=3075591 RepID=A0ABU3E1K0_9FLAO|nr:polysaccharide biosynthesis/export family protein [Salegentibacter sp. F188]MDT0689842.1 polysaccharide biosynthesis/export family protein [Salegentibacter sp. F188]